jgi:hypothetical protein
MKLLVTVEREKPIYQSIKTQIRTEGYKLLKGLTIDEIRGDEDAYEFLEELLHMRFDRRVSKDNSLRQGLSEVYVRGVETVYSDPKILQIKEVK